MKTIYFIRHSKTLSVDNKFNEDSIQEEDEKKFYQLKEKKLPKKNLRILSLTI